MYMNINSLCGKCKYLKKCHADKRIVIECKRYEPTEEYEKFISEVKKILGEMKPQDRLNIQPYERMNDKD